MKVDQKPSESPPTLDAAVHPPADRVSVIAETLSVGKVEQDIGAIRVRIEVDEQPEFIATDTWTHEVAVERVSKDEVVQATRAPWHEGDALVVPVYRERVVVVREWVLVEEIRLRTTSRLQVQQPSEVRLRRERAVVERQRADGTWGPAEVQAGDDSAGNRSSSAAGSAPHLHSPERKPS